MTKIVIRRASAAWQDRRRDYVVLLDGKEYSKVSNGANVEIGVKPGKHSVQIKIDWCRSIMFDINAEHGETVMLECGPNSTPLLTLLYITLWKDKYIWLRRLT